MQSNVSDDTRPDFAVRGLADAATILNQWKRALDILPSSPIRLKIESLSEIAAPNFKSPGGKQPAGLRAEAIATGSDEKLGVCEVLYDSKHKALQLMRESAVSGRAHYYQLLDPASRDANPRLKQLPPAEFIAKHLRDLFAEQTDIAMQDKFKEMLAAVTGTSALNFQ